MPGRSNATPVSSRRQTRRSVQLGQTPRPWISNSRTRSLLVPETSLQEDVVKRIFDEFLTKSYKASRVSPLFNFLYDSRSLLKYQRHLLETVRESKSPDTELVIRIKRIKKLRSQDSRSDAVSIRIANHEDLLENKPIYQCVLCSLSDSSLTDNLKNFVVLPLMLWNGNRTFKELVDKFLMQQFKCNIWPIVFRPVDLEWLAVIYAANEQYPSPTQLTYTSVYHELNSIKYILDDETVTTMVRSIVHPDSSELTFEHVGRVMKVIKTHFLALTCIDLDQLRLREIRTASVNVGSTGSIKIKHHENLLQILRFLTNIAESLLSDEGQNIEDSSY